MLTNLQSPQKREQVRRAAHSEEAADSTPLWSPEVSLVAAFDQYSPITRENAAMAEIDTIAISKVFVQQINAEHCAFGHVRQPVEHALDVYNCRHSSTVNRGSESVADPTGRS